MAEEISGLRIEKLRAAPTTGGKSRLKEKVLRRSVTRRG